MFLFPRVKLSYPSLRERRIFVFLRGLETSVLTPLHTHTHTHTMPMEIKRGITAVAYLLRDHTNAHAASPFSQTGTLIKPLDIFSGYKPARHCPPR